MKPENLLCNGTDLVKIADFGLAREIRSRPPFTDYVSTRWYRAPEVLLRSTSYNSPIDLWAVGCIMAELFTLRPLFPGSSEVDEIYKVVAVLGTPSQDAWAEGHKLAAAMHFRFPQMVPTPLKTLIPNASKAAIDLMKDLMAWNPASRPSCVQSLRYSFFTDGEPIPPTIDNIHARPVVTAPRVQSSVNAPQPVAAPPRQRDSIPELQPVKPSAQLPPIAPSHAPQPKPVQQAPAQQPSQRHSSLDFPFDDDDMFGGKPSMPMAPVAVPRRKWDTPNRENPADKANATDSLFGRNESLQQHGIPKSQWSFPDITAPQPAPQNKSSFLPDIGFPRANGAAHYAASTRYMPTELGLPAAAMFSNKVAVVTKPRVDEPFPTLAAPASDMSSALPYINRGVKANEVNRRTDWAAKYASK